MATANPKPSKASAIKPVQFTTNDDGLVPCPFCGESESLRVNEYSDPEDKAKSGREVWSLYCNGCGAEGPCVNTRDEAIKGWNKSRAGVAAANVDKKRSLTNDSTIVNAAIDASDTGHEILAEALRTVGIGAERQLERLTDGCIENARERNGQCDFAMLNVIPWLLMIVNAVASELETIRRTVSVAKMAVEQIDTEGTEDVATVLNDQVDSELTTIVDRLTVAVVDTKTALYPNKG